MTFMQFIILQLIAHLLVDFTFQSDADAREKNEGGFRSKSLKWHILKVFIVSWVFSFQWRFVAGAFLLALLHLLIDGFKKKICALRRVGKHGFFIDQGLHLATVIAISALFFRFFEVVPLFALPQAYYLTIILGYLACTKPANILIKEVFLAYKIKVSETNDLPNAGKLIGIIERWLVLTFIIFNKFEAVGFLIAAKSILRYKDDNTLKTEYVLIGTMLSFGLAIGAGIAILQV